MLFFAITEDDLKVRVKRWLKETRRTRQFLADRCGVELKTVNNWLSSKRPIPAKARLIIGKLIQSDAGSETAPPPEDSVLSIHVDVARFDAYNRASLAEGLTIREWVLRALDDAATGNRPEPE
ncbi:MAG TPA: hypothetical protein PLA50_04405 [Bacteroidia bacterium]|nr:hypothetical protein [Bacteroidia bacterium]